MGARACSGFCFHRHFRFPRKSMRQQAIALPAFFQAAAARCPSCATPPFFLDFLPGAPYSFARLEAL